MQIKQKRKKHGQLIKDLYRFLSFSIAPYLVKTGISANQITLIRIPCIIIGCIQVILI